METTMKFISLIFVLTLSFGLSETLHAASIAKVKGRKVLIKAEGTELEAGKVFFIISESGKKRGLVKIKKVKGSKAIGVISKKSRAKKGWTLRKRVRKVAKRRKRMRKDDEYDPRSKMKNMAIGAVLGMNMGNMSVEQIGISPNYNTSDLSGSGFSAKVLADYRLFGGLWFRGMFGMEMLTLEDDPANAVCSESDSNVFDKPCVVEINYLTLDLHARYVFGMSTFRPWVGGGIDLLLPISNTTTALNEDKIQIANTFVGAFGADIHFSPTLMAPIQVEYNFFPPADTVSANFIAIRLGLAYKF